MSEWKDGRRGKKYVGYFIIIWLLQMAAAFWFCTQKQGFHEDEFYTYYSTARTNGFYVEDGKWMERDAYRNEFVVLPGERFQYGLVKQVQSWDVHPPMYYWVFHTVASFVPGVFSKWIGLSVNLVFHGMNLILLTYLSYLTAGRDVRQALLVTLVYGFGPAVMSGVVFIRMYEMLTTFVLMCAILHVRAVLGLHVKTLLAMAAVTYVGFLTQYYYFIFLFFLAIAFCVWLLWHDRKIGNCLRYGLAQGVAFALAYLTYPAFPGQMFRGQRGAQATENFFDWSNTFERLSFFWDLLNRYVFGGLLGLILLFLVAAAVAKHVHNRDNVEAGGGCLNDAAFYMLLVTAVGYFLAVSKTALLLGDTSNRYQLPVYGIFLMLLVLGAAKVLGRISKLTAAAFCLAVVGLSYVRADVVFLYPEAGEAVDFAREQAAAHTPVVYVYHPGEEWCIWAVADELMEYDRVYFVSAASEEPITEPAITDADAVVVYLPLYEDAGDETERSRRLFSENVRLSESHLQYSHKYCEEWYYCGDGAFPSSEGDFAE